MTVSAIAQTATIRLGSTVALVLAALVGVSARAPRSTYVALR
jgi:hypothetical protein